jgi:outer membrane protein OmpA-like peptidoglycan-associated protein
MKYVLTIILALTLYFPTFAEDGFKWCLYFSDLNYPIKPEYEAQFDELAEFIKSYPDSLFKISGYLDMRASDIDRLKQALWTRKYLIEHYDIPSSMLLVAVGKLKDDPYIKDAKTEDEQEWNRRAEIKFIKKK